MVSDIFKTILFMTSVCALSACASAQTESMPESHKNNEIQTNEDGGISSEKAATITISWPKHWISPELDEENCQEVDEHTVECSRLKNDETILSWGSVWEPVTITQDKLKNGKYDLALEHMIPAWSVQQLDLLLRPQATSVAIEDECLAKPGYKIAMVQYCLDDQLGGKQCKAKEISADRSEFRLPSLQEMAWGKDQPLPNNLSIELVKTSVNPRYKNRFSIQIPLKESDLNEDGMLKNTIYEAGLFLINTPELPKVKYDSSARFSVFASRAACIASDIKNRHAWRPYARSALSDTKFAVNACAWAKVVKGGKDISRCVKAKVSDEKVEFPLVSNQIRGDRLILVIARAVSFENDGTGAEIQSTLLEWLKEKKKQNIQIPLNLLTIDGDGKVRQILRGEDLNSLAVASNKKNPPPNIEGLVGQSITFHAEGFRPLKDLEFVERKLSALGINKIRKVLYVTDGRLPNKIFNAELGTPLGWGVDGVELFVATKGSCTPWTERVRVPASRCVSINAKQDVEGFNRFLAMFQDSAENALSIQTSE